MAARLDRLGGESGDLGPAAAAMILLIISTFWHARLGLQVLIEDYIHQGGSRFALTALLNLAVIAGAVFGVFCIASIAFAGAA